MDIIDKSHLRNRPPRLLIDSNTILNDWHYSLREISFFPAVLDFFIKVFFPPENCLNQTPYGMDFPLLVAEYDRHLYVGRGKLVDSVLLDEINDFIISYFIDMPMDVGEAVTFYEQDYVRKIRAIMKETAYDGDLDDYYTRDYIHVLYNNCAIILYAIYELIKESVFIHHPGYIEGIQYVITNYEYSRSKAILHEELPIMIVSGGLTFNDEYEMNWQRRFYDNPRTY